MRLAILFVLAALATPIDCLAGLDITAYSHLVKVEHPVLDKDGSPVNEDSEVLLAPVDSPDRFRDLEPNTVYKFQGRFEFRAGSYSGYNWWRNELARIAGYHSIAAKTVAGKVEDRYDEGAWEAESGPFWELINFSDAEGVIGPVACRKLYADFQKFHERAMAHPNPAFRESYLEWEKALSLAVNNGALEFH